MRREVISAVNKFNIEVDQVQDSGEIRVPDAPDYGKPIVPLYGAHGLWGILAQKKNVYDKKYKPRAD